MTIRLTLGFILFLVTLIACNKDISKTGENRNYAKVENNYKKEWQKVEALEKKGLAKSIIQTTDSILLKAKSEDNYHQMFKAMAYRSRYINQIEENAHKKILDDFISEAETAEFPLNLILHSATAELLHQYLNSNRFRFQNRTKLIEEVEGDYESWSLEKIHQTINHHYQLSIQDGLKAAQFPLENINEILHLPLKTDYSVYNNLYDLLSFRALSYFKISPVINEGLESFESDDYSIFADRKEFINVKAIYKDSTDHNYNTFKLYQDILSQDLNDSKKVTYDLDRLSHYYNISNADEKDSSYQESLLGLKKKFPNNHEITYKLASFYLSKSKEESTTYSTLQAYQLLSNSDLSKADFGSLKSKELLETITQSDFSFQMENIIPPATKRPLLLRFKNINQFYFRIYDVSQHQSNLKGRSTRQSTLQFVLDLEAKNFWSKRITYAQDYELHSTELTLPKLDIGQYCIVVSSDSLFKNEQTEYSFFQVSQLSNISRNSSEKWEIYVLDRRHGLPIENTVIDVFEDHQWSLPFKNKKIFRTLKTNDEGYASLPKPLRKRMSSQYIVHSKNDTIDGSLYFPIKSKNTNKQLQLFTDRAIYRPGQTVHFKGLLTQYFDHSSELLANENIEVECYDVNRQKFSSLKLKTNAYGSIHGFFILPKSGLNGFFELRTSYGSLRIRVEEYKRPTFEIVVDSIQESIQLNDTVFLSGKIKGFAGNNISKAKLKYRVVRKSGYPDWYFRYCSFFPFPSSTKEIAQGETSSSTDGSIEFNFLAKAPKDPDNNQFYNYEVLLSATSLNGETQETTYTIPISNQPIVLGTNLNKSEAFIKEFKQLKIITKTLANQPIDTKAELSLHKLKPLLTYTIDRPWSKPDVWSLSEQDYRNLHFSSNSEKKSRIDYLVSQSLVKTNKTLDLFNEILPGSYLLKLKWTDEDGQEYHYEQEYNLYTEKSSENVIPKFFNLITSNQKLNVGDTLKVLINTALKNLHLLYELENKNNVIESRFIDLNHEQKLLSIPIKEEYRGGVYIHLNGFHSNQSISKAQYFEVPYDNKKLNVKLNTYRDKVEPGDTEKWSISIKDHQNKTVDGELLLCMYDASLDQFVNHQWDFQPFYRRSFSSNRWNTYAVYYRNSMSPYHVNYKPRPQRIDPRLNWFGLRLDHAIGIYYSRSEMSPMALDDAMIAENNIEEFDAGLKLRAEDQFNDLSATSVDKEKAKKSFFRKNFNETVFFYPELSFKNGKASFEFKIPDVLTEWKLMALAHTKELSTGHLTQSIISQKEVMVFPNAPRFLREDDTIRFSALVSNMSEKNLDAKVSLQFIDPISKKPVNMISDQQTSKTVSLLKNGNAECHWTIVVPRGYKILSYRIMASTERHSDGEEKSIPVLLNRKLITETLPFGLRASEKKQYNWEKLANSERLETLEHKSLTLEYTPNPVWYAIQALPYLTEKNTPCTEALFSRLFANSIAEHIVNQNPKIKAVFNVWKDFDQSELLSNLEKNQDLKLTLISNTPWLEEAKSESEQKRRIGLLFDYNQMAVEKNEALNELRTMQNTDGSWPWYKGMKGSRYITQYILAGLGRMYKMGLLDDTEMIEKGIKYLDQKYLEDFEKSKTRKIKEHADYLSSITAHYLFVRSYFMELPLPKNRSAFDHYMKLANANWHDQNPYLKGMIALIFHRYKPNMNTSIEIIKSLKEYAISNHEDGMHWKNSGNSGYWYEAKIESQALLIEAFEEIGKHKKEIEEMKIWLLRQKQTQSWSTSKSTTLACYALINSGVSLLNQNSNVNLSIGKELINSEHELKSAGTNYFQKQWSGQNVNASQSSIHVINNGDSYSWGALYWQYYQNLDKVTSNRSSSLTIEKQLYKVEWNELGEILIPMDQKTIQKGDVIRSRIKISTDRDLEFVHLNDMRASLFEPLEVLSGHRFQDGLTYYQNISDVASDFYFDFLPKGEYIFEHSLKANVAGEATKGIASIQCYYAPELMSHSDGGRISIK